MTDIEIRFGNDNLVTRFTYWFVEQLFECNILFLCNSSELDEFLILPNLGFTDFYTDLYICPSSVPNEQQNQDCQEKKETAKNKPDLECKLSSSSVSEKEREKKEKKLEEAGRSLIKKLIEENFGVSMKNYPKKELYAWEVAEYVRERLPRNLRPIFNE
ncbi:MAG: hypothetical protein ACFFCZ_00585 [Promethearchaeota archaeon]